MPLSEYDEFLEILLEMASEVDKKLRLTVFSGGLAVSGTVVAEDTFFEALNLPSFAQSSRLEREENDRAYNELTTRLHKMDRSVAEKFVLLEGASALKRQFIMMVDVTILGAGPNPITAPVWRGRLSQISGWTFGAPDERDSPDEQ